MFVKTYTNTLKILFRSVLFYVALIVAIAVPLSNAIKGGSGMYSLELGEMIWDTDPRYVLVYKRYIILIQNIGSSWIMVYAMPIFALITSFLVVNRDYRDGFYEIEKSRGVRTSTYLSGRLAALITVNTITLIATFLTSINWYVFTRGGVSGMGLWEYISDSTVRCLRYAICVMLPSVLVWIMLTYAVGVIFKSGWIGAFASVTYIAVHYLSLTVLRFRTPEWFRYLLSPSPYHLRHYFYYYDTEWFTGTLQGTSLTKAIYCILILLGVSLLYGMISYIATRRREV